MRSIAVFVLVLCSCTVSDATVTRVAEANGLHDVEPASWAPMSCGKGDTLRSHFTAKNAAGKDVRGTVCCGLLFKECTVRFE